MQEPVDIKPTLQALVFCIGIRFLPITGHPPTERDIKRFHIISMNIVLAQRGRCVWMFWLWSLIFVTFASSVMGLGAFVFDPDLDLLGASVAGDRGGPCE